MDHDPSSPYWTHVTPCLYHALRGGRATLFIITPKRVSPSFFTSRVTQLPLSGLVPIVVEHAASLAAPHVAMSLSAMAASVGQLCDATQSWGQRTLSAGDVAGKAPGTLLARPVQTGADACAFLAQTLCHTPEHRPSQEGQPMWPPPCYMVSLNMHGRRQKDKGRQVRQGKETPAPRPVGQTGCLDIVYLRSGGALLADIGNGQGCLSEALMPALRPNAVQAVVFLTPPPVDVSLIDTPEAMALAVSTCPDLVLAGALGRGRGVESVSVNDDDIVGGGLLNQYAPPLPSMFRSHVYPDPSSGTEGQVDTNVPVSGRDDREYEVSEEVFSDSDDDDSIYYETPTTPLDFDILSD
ncbi:hypothetical protein KIPB_009765 [Kipferlia bialata]|uniref:Uncharacterized protein n=1 Tax=Kipferlia bialata TaxID=797122 RepID=A0A9K3GL27_9EUKA|nr:hypothetical protein KIPB_009765 [Kipferlia bialata]|eukprot:g9765.t1